MASGQVCDATRASRGALCVHKRAAPAEHAMNGRRAPGTCHDAQHAKHGCMIMLELAPCGKWPSKHKHSGGWATRCMREEICAAMPAASGPVPCAHGAPCEAHAGHAPCNMWSTTCGIWPANMPCRIMPCAKCGLDAMRVTDLDRPTRGMHAGAAHMMVCIAVVGALAGRAPLARGPRGPFFECVLLKVRTGTVM